MVNNDPTKRFVAFAVVSPTPIIAAVAKEEPTPALGTTAETRYIPEVACGRAYIVVGVAVAIDAVVPLDVLIAAATIALLKIWLPLHVGEIVTFSAGAESEVMNVVSMPLTADNPTDADGFAPAGYAGSAVHCGAVAPAFTVRYFPARPIARSDVAPDPVLYGKLPAPPPAMFVAVVALVALPVQEPEDPDTVV